MQVTMDMCSGDLEQEGYGTEVMCAGWNPAVRAMGEATAGLATRFVALQVQRHEPSRRMPADLAATDLDAFLRKMYAAQR